MATVSACRARPVAIAWLDSFNVGVLGIQTLSIPRCVGTVQVVHAGIGCVLRGFDIAGLCLATIVVNIREHVMDGGRVYPVYPLNTVGSPEMINNALGEYLTTQAAYYYRDFILPKAD